MVTFVLDCPPDILLVSPKITTKTANLYHTQASLILATIYTQCTSQGVAMTDRTINNIRFTEFH
jgi:hypothetical protein